MNILLWVLQGILALLYLAGGGFKTAKADELTRISPSVPRALWLPLGLVEIVGGIMLVAPMALGWKPHLTAIAAAVLAAETLLLAAIYASKSVKLVSANPMVWALVMGALVSFVAYGRYVLVPAA
jgi:VIT1/CCC1 family predicted Fe2+/Mn2+ transporter